MNKPVNSGHGKLLTPRRPLYTLLNRRGGVAQVVERWSRKAKAGSSSPGLASRVHPPPVDSAVPCFGSTFKGDR